MAHSSQIVGEIALTCSLTFGGAASAMEIIPAQPQQVGFEALKQPELATWSPITTGVSVGVAIGVGVVLGGRALLKGPPDKQFWPEPY